MEAFGASLRSVGTAATLTAAGVYLHRRALVSRENKIVLARFCQQIALPALFFSKMVFCQQNGRADLECPNIVRHLGDAWILLVWPLYTCTWGLCLGWLVTYLAQTPPGPQRRSAIAAVGFANANALPLTLLGVVHDDLMRNTLSPSEPILMTEPSLLISLYCTVQPILMWGFGGWLLSSEERHDEAQDKVNDHEDEEGNTRRHDATATDTALSPSSNARVGENVPLVFAASDDVSTVKNDELSRPNLQHVEEKGGEATPTPLTPTTAVSEVWMAMKQILTKSIQPPTLGVMFGLICTGIRPLRSLFVNLKTRRGGAPLEWIFDAVYTLGHAQIPLSMTVLGINLSLAAQNQQQQYRPLEQQQTDVSNSTTTRKNDHAPASASSSVTLSTLTAVLIAKLIIMPMIGIASTLFLKTYLLRDSVPEELRTSLWLVLMTEFCTPTATNIMIIADIYDKAGAKEGMAQIIGFQYMFAPILLSVSMMAVVHVATMT